MGLSWCLWKYAYISIWPGYFYYTVLLLLLEESYIVKEKTHFYSKFFNKSHF